MGTRFGPPTAGPACPSRTSLRPRPGARDTRCVTLDLRKLELSERGRSRSAWDPRSSSTCRWASWTRSRSRGSSSTAGRSRSPLSGKCRRRSARFRQPGQPACNVPRGCARPALGMTPLPRFDFVEQHLYRTAYTLMAASTDQRRRIDMMRKNKETREKEHGLARVTPSPFDWFQEMDRWFDDFRRSVNDRVWGSSLSRPEETSFQVREPLVDLIDKGSEFVVWAELPGVAKEDVDLTVTPDGIQIRAEANRSREEKEKNYYYQDRTYRALQRALKFPAEVKADLAAANLKDGVLEVRVPKKEPTAEPKPVKVPVE